MSNKKLLCLLDAFFGFFFIFLRLIKFYHPINGLGGLTFLILSSCLSMRSVASRNLVSLPGSVPMALAILATGPSSLAELDAGCVTLWAALRGNPPSGGEGEGEIRTLVHSILDPDP